MAYTAETSVEPRRMTDCSLTDLEGQAEEKRPRL